MSEKRMRKVLVVDDDQSLRRDIVDMLGYEGYAVLGATNGLQALAILDGYLPDVIITDIMMPVMDGFTFLKQVRDSLQHRHIAIIVLSARSDKIDIRKGMNLGANDYIIKPIYSHELIDSIEARLQMVDKQFEPNTHQIDTFALCIGVEVASKNYTVTNLASSDLNVIRQFIAVNSPNIILLENNLDLMHKLREFSLSRTLPMIVALDSADVTHLIESGADECVSLETPDIGNAITRALSQYAKPKLVERGVAWKVACITTDIDLYSNVSKVFTELFYADVVHISSNETLKEAQYDLILLDGDLQAAAVVHQFNEACPIILIIDQTDVSLLERQFDCGINGWIEKPVTKANLKIVVEKLLRWGREIRSLLEMWSDHQLMSSETKFQYEMQSKNPRLAALLVETTALYSGLIHDLRSGFGIIRSFVDLENPSEAFLQSLGYVEMLLEIIAEARLKGMWRCKVYEQDYFIRAVQKAVQCFQSATSINVEMSVEDNYRMSIMMDDRQVSHAVLGLLLAVSEQENVQVIRLWLLSSAKIVAQAFDENHQPVPLKNFLTESNPTVYALVARKVFERHRATIDAEETLTIKFKSGVLSDEEQRLDIAYAYRDIEQYQGLRSQLPPLEKAQGLDVFMQQPVQELVTHCARLVTLSPNERIRKSTRYALLLARDMLYATAGHQPELTVVDLHEVIQTLLELRRSRWGDCDVVIDLAKDPVRILAEENGMLQILVNLTTNAVEAMNGEGTLTIATRNGTETVELRVSDRGKGIPAEERDSIFDLHFTTKSGHERGVGLHVVKSLVQQFNGSVSVQSQLNVGTTFTLSFPSADSAPVTNVPRDN